jgi:putative transposase
LWAIRPVESRSLTNDENPADGAAKGVKRGLLCEGAGVPIGLVAAKTNRVDFKLARGRIESIPVPRPKPTRRKPQELCSDTGCDYGEVRDLALESGHIAHIRAWGEEALRIKRSLQGPALSGRANS